MINEEQFKTPLFDAMVALAESRKVSFHTPGHKSGKGISTRFRKFVGPNIFSIDLTSLDEVDSLQKPRGVIKESQELAARAYGADRSFFLLNGTSGGNHAMMLASCHPNDQVLIARNAHKSVLAGLIFSGARPVFFSPAVDKDLKLTLNVTAADTRAAIDANPAAMALILTTPNYYGITADLEAIIPYAHKKGLTVLVDEAHGPHLSFHPRLPISAMQAGADLSVQSTHKIIGGMTQASMLHAQGGRMDMAALASAIRFIQSTSPSYILMASLDLARMQMATEGEKLLEKTIQLAEEARSRINRIPGLFCFDRNALKKKQPLEKGDFDVTKLTISVQDLGLSGYRASRILNNNYHIQVEMADPLNILVIVSIGDRQDDLNRLVDALREMSKKYHGTRLPKRLSAEVGLPPFGKPTGITPREAYFKDHEPLPLEQARGAVCAEIVTVYPPGIPLLIPGEIITTEVIDYIRQMDQLGATIDGLDPTGNSLSVIKR
ncbi:MAG TPA: aminotransferase class I/II-fold pyridoxal phosphate-dependent enzyme [Nitrospiria bacterium]|nr:aminotransferase class I/II-fold pyridoxal phosphate-dependent enzyme [Candidatus Manganitrophaceae bacterium]HIL34057.1 aminotransferase class I/II-fold pyridoxal phosphate-dependent enzyme [Candidatus Manganitrophaceae bacterium]